MRAIKIDVAKNKIYEVDYDGSLKGLYELIGCTCVCAPLEYENGDTLWADDESLLNEDDETFPAGFIFPGWGTPIVGNAVITGTNDKGKSIKAKTNLFDLKDIIWITKEQCIAYRNKVMA